MRVSVKAVARQLTLLVLGLGLIGVLVYFGGLRDIDRLLDLEALPAGLALLATYAITGCVALRWRALAHAIAQREVATRADYFHYFVLSRLIGYVVPKDISDIAGRTGWLTNKHPIKLSEAGLSIVFDRLLDLLVIAIMALAALPFWLGWYEIHIGLIVLGVVTFVGVLAAALFGSSLLAPGVWAFNRVRAWLAKLRRKPAPVELDLLGLDRRLSIEIVALSMVKFWATAARNALFLAALGLEIAPGLLVLGTPVGQLAYLFAFTPGGLGIFEAGWVGILVFAGASLEVGTAFAVGQRVLTLIMIAMLATASLLYRTLIRRP